MVRWTTMKGQLLSRGFSSEESERIITQQAKQQRLLDSRESFSLFDSLERALSEKMADKVPKINTGSSFYHKFKPMR